MHHHLETLEIILKLLEKDELIKLRQEDTAVIYITAAGLEKSKLN